MGRPALYAPKNGTRTYRITRLTQRGEQLTERLRRAMQLRESKASVSDSDVLDEAIRIVFGAVLPQSDKTQ